MTCPKEFSDRILAWHRHHGRTDLPWQHNPTPYQVWVSEIMLQQTRVTTVIPYFQRFMQRFPDLPNLALAPVDDVLHHWSGLGYYARARNLHQAARQIMEHHGGEFPTAMEPLQALPGIGRSTAGAVLSLACGQRHPILDGNVKRVLARCFAVSGWPGKAAVLRRLWELAERHTPIQRVGHYNQAMMDLGATLCTRSAPRCDDCPLHAPCLARQQGRQTDYPQPRPRKRQLVRKTHLLLLRSPAGEILLERRPPSGIWGGLWSFPECVQTAEIERYCADQFGFQAGALEFHSPRRHTFTHFHLDYTPVEIPVQQQLQRIKEGGRQLWHHPNAAPPGGLAAPVAKLIDELKTANKQETPMSRIVKCVKLNREAEGLERRPYPGNLGQRIFDNVSKEAWQEWLKQQTMLINEYRLSPIDPKARKFLEEQMEKYFFGEGAEAPPDFVPQK